MAEPQVAVLIDYENVGLASLESLLDQLSDVGRIIIKRAYADWSVARDARDRLLELGLEAVHHFHSAKSGKNSSDVCLAIDAVDLLYRSPVDTFVIVSADTDFVPLVSKLRASGKTVIGAGRRAVVSESLVKSCDRYIYLGEAIPASTSPSPEPDAGRQVIELVVRALEASTDVQGQVPASKLHQTMRRIDPSFDYKALGYRTFTQFLEQVKEIELTRPGGPGDIAVRLRAQRERREAEQAPISQKLSQWEDQLHETWSARARTSGESLPGPWAAGEAAKVLGIPRLKGSKFPTLQSLLDSSPLLRSNWSRRGNAIVKI